jgi:tRNA threonylcarbamoyladenosine modification (KEOPS) complex  Pcc1 subunit
MSNKATAYIRLQFAQEKQLTSLLEALSPETQVAQTRRANVKLEKDGSTLVLRIEAEDTVALRATLNAYLRWINSAVNVIDMVEQA